MYVHEILFYLHHKITEPQIRTGINYFFYVLNITGIPPNSGGDKTRILNGMKRNLNLSQLLINIPNDADSWRKTKTT